MYKLSFKVRHKGCSETALSSKFPKHHITVVDIQSLHHKEKQYLYYIPGRALEFDSIIKTIKNSSGYKFAKEIERSKVPCFFWLCSIKLHTSRMSSRNTTHS